MDETAKRRLATVRSKMINITREIEKLDPENPIHAFYRDSLVKARAAFQRQESILMNAPDELE